MCAKQIGISSPRMYQLMEPASSVGLSDESAIKMAELLEMDAAIVLADLRLAQAKSEAAKAVWQTVAERLASTAMGVLILMGLFGPPPANASTGAGPEFFAASCLYIMSNRIRKAGRALRRFLASPAWVTPFRRPFPIRPSIC